VDGDDRFALLDEEARELAPRLFALYGVYRKSLYDGDDEREFLAWGMEFPDSGGALMWDGPHSTWSGDSAAQLLHTHERIADTRLVWLDD
jgi:hypothetical protein